MSFFVVEVVAVVDVDADGVLNVSAQEKGSGKSQSIQIKNEKGRLTPEEIEKRRKRNQKKNKRKI